MLLVIVAVSFTSMGAWHAHQLAEGPDPKKNDALDARFAAKVQPFVESYCIGCHGGKKPKAQLDLSRDLNLKVAGVVKNMQHWEGVLERLEANEMPPEDAPRRASA
jgi:hypothetical protein